ncbi:MAG TPA: Mur ligase family protein, partial [Aquaticitalea sp.]|nr:Mur ligase family protein [Aquaticitalea sp.]
MEIKEIYTRFLQCTSACTDTRKFFTQDCMFFALKGENFDGNYFVEQALELGARYCVVDNPDHQGKDCILVDDVLSTLQQLATHHRNQLNFPIIALTGSNGKTTTKELINAVLSKKFRTIATIENLNNHIGVPLTILAMNKKTEIGIVEMGANHPKEIEFLCKIAQPDYGLITNFGRAHLEGFGSIEGVIRAKSELYDYLKAHQKTIFVNENDKIQVQQAAAYDRVLYFGQMDPDGPE